jgi:hypothetical protein
MDLHVYSSCDVVKRKNRFIAVEPLLRLQPAKEFRPLAMLKHLFLLVRPSSQLRQSHLLRVELLENLVLLMLSLQLPVDPMLDHRYT